MINQSENVTRIVNESSIDTIEELSNKPRFIKSQKIRFTKHIYLLWSFWKYENVDISALYW
jgi:hypothetical protein